MIRSTETAGAVYELLSRTTGSGLRVTGATLIAVEKGTKAALGSEDSVEESLTCLKAAQVVLVQTGNRRTWPTWRQ